jgi:hypothetical protein
VLSLTIRKLCQQAILNMEIPFTLKSEVSIMLKTFENDVKSFVVFLKLALLTMKFIFVTF